MFFSNIDERNNAQEDPSEVVEEDKIKVEEYPENVNPSSYRRSISLQSIRYDPNSLE